jgi:SPRY domain
MITGGMNSLHNEALSWIGDGSSGNTLTQKANDLIIESKSTGTPFNLRVNSEKASDGYYWQANIQKLKGNVSFGAVTKDEFKPGWKAKGVFYNGNLTNGSGALQVNWGPMFEAGDSVGVQVAPGSDALEVSFYKNGECLGTGFRLPKTTETFYPCLHISGSASLRIEAPPELPSREVSTSTATGFFDDWRLEKAWDGQKSVDFPDAPIKLALAKGNGNALKISFKIANNVNGTGEIVEETETTLKVKIGPFMMTRMMPPPEYRPLESMLGTKKITTISLDDNCRLTVAGPEIKTEWSRFVRVPRALTAY